MSDMTGAGGGGMIDLEQRLLQLGDAVEFPATPGLAAAVRTRLAAETRQPSAGRGAARQWWRSRPGADAGGPWSLLRNWQRRAAALGLALALVAAVVLGVEPVRTTVAHWLGVRGVEVRPVQTLPPVPTRTAVPPGAPLGAGLNIGEPVSLETARSRAGFTVLLPAELGPPDAVWLYKTKGAQNTAVTLVYRPRPGLPESGQSGVGLLVTEVAGTIDSRLFGKFIGPDTTLLPVTVGGHDQGYWIGGMHDIVYAAPGGGFDYDTVRLAGPTLLFEHGSTTIRIEGNLDQASAVRLAATLR
jgi:hypothetical protein